MWKSKRYVQLLDTPDNLTSHEFKLPKRKKHSEFFSLQNLETGKFKVHYIIVDVETYPRRTIVIEDNR